MIIRCFHAIKFRFRLYFCNDIPFKIRDIRKLNIIFPHPIGIVIGKNVKIGKNCTFYQNVTIGAKTVEESTSNKYPHIGNNVIIGANVVVFGEIYIGDNVYIGAGAIVNKDVPNNCMVFGNPMKIVKI